MFKKILIIGIFFISLQNCGFSPLYKDFSDQDLNIKILELSGDRETFNLIQTKLKKFSKNTGNEVFKIKINTKYTKMSIAKDTSGQTTNYRSKIVSNFQIEYKNKIKNIRLNESFDFKKIDDQFAELDYEKSVKNSMTNIIVQKLISQLLRDR
tara:strand:+ start:2407 stop:2865 length:459 start_codon:yes stop_codon:yes gene_type:complete